MSVFLLAFLLGLTAAQPHHPDPEAGVTCYDCGGHGPDHEFPQCLMHTKQCHHDEACMIMYGGHHTEVRCHRREECHGWQQESAADCPAGGHKEHDSCRLCCHDDSCLTDTMDKLQQLASIPNQGKGVHCPGECPLNNINLCLSFGHMCNDNEFCKVTRDDNNGRVEAHCENLEEVRHCHREVQDGHCDPHHHHCSVGCCTDDQCMTMLLGGNSTTTTTQPETTTSLSSQTSTGGSGGGLNTLTCGDLAQLDCSVLVSLCPLIHCASVCDPCLNLPSTTGAPTTAVPVGTSAPSVSAGTTVATSPPPTTGSACVDTIQNMACADVADVCSSPLLLSFCQKHCGLC